MGVDQPRATVTEPSNHLPDDQVCISDFGAFEPWRDRRYIPHYLDPQVIQHVTFHLADSLPAAALERLREQLAKVPKSRRDAERRKRLDHWLDAGYGSCTLRPPAVANMVQKSLLHFHRTRYDLLAWTVMPNHVHALVKVADDWSLANVVATWKTFTAKKIIEYRGTTGLPARGKVWHREYWDRFIRDRNHLRHTYSYIAMNAVRAGLVRHPSEWPCSSSYRGGGVAPTPGNARRRTGVVNHSL
jgi:REP element-mobilizing transposase RayT